MSTGKTYLLDTHALIWYQDAHSLFLIGIAEAEGAVILTDDGNYPLYHQFVQSAW